MPLNAMKRVEPLFDRLVRSLKPGRIMQETARGDRASYFRNFKGYRAEKFSRPKMAKIARKEVFVRQTEFWAQLLIVLWNEAHRDIYIGFRDRVQTLDEDVEKVTRIEEEIADKWISEMLEQFALEDLLICVHLNEVRFTDAFIRRRLESPLNIERDANDVAHNGAAELDADNNDNDAQTAPAEPEGE
ncbi:MAG: hypothetical protein VX223_04985 [Myxococcota bacterium]|nr:hypothetical protein [Myxococcota bacterium]